MSAKYYYTVKGKRQGPVTLDELKLLAVRAELRRSDSLWTEGMAAWQPAGLTTPIFEGLPPDFEPVERTMAPPPLPTDAQTSGSNPRAKPLSPGLIVAIIILVAIVIMVIINLTIKYTHDRDFQRVIEGLQNAAQ